MERPSFVCLSDLLFLELKDSNHVFLDLGVWSAMGQGTFTHTVHHLT